MQQAYGELVEIYLENGLTGGRLLCPQNLIPSPGQYLLAHDPASHTPLPVPVFSAGSVPGGFLVAPPLGTAWRPGVSLSLRGPLGCGFSLPPSARCVALVALAGTDARLRPLLAAALGGGAAVVLVTDLELTGLPAEVEIQPVSALAQVVKWADYMALDVLRESLPGVREKLGPGGQARVECQAQVLVLTPMPCGGMAECGVCAVTLRRGWKMPCKDGPVFNLVDLI
jgi:dihydroorotate dehydrogenase electron transfer subunit